LIESTLTVTDL